MKNMTVWKLSLGLLLCSCENVHMGNRPRETALSLNSKQYGGYNDWRLPALEEAMSLMEPKKHGELLYIDPLFDKTQGWIWTSDLKVTGRAWYVFFGGGNCNHYDVGDSVSVRAVRSGQSII
jgi:hypothetical protein